MVFITATAKLTKREWCGAVESILNREAQRKKRSTAFKHRTRHSTAHTGKTLTPSHMLPTQRDCIHTHSTSHGVSTSSPTGRGASRNGNVIVTRRAPLLLPFDLVTLSQNSNKGVPPAVLLAPTQSYIYGRLSATKRCVLQKMEITKMPLSQKMDD